MELPNPQKHQYYGIAHSNRHRQHRAGRPIGFENGNSVRLHDCRARNVIEAIMWHGCSREGGQSDARWTVERFRQLSKADRDAVVKFINAI